MSVVKDEFLKPFLLTSCNRIYVMKTWLVTINGRPLVSSGLKKMGFLQSNVSLLNMHSRDDKVYQARFG